MKTYFQGKVEKHLKLEMIVMGKSMMTKMKTLSHPLLLSNNFLVKTQMHNGNQQLPPHQEDLEKRKMLRDSK